MILVMRCASLRGKQASPTLGLQANSSRALGGKGSSSRRSWARAHVEGADAGGEASPSASAADGLVGRRECGRGKAACPISRSCLTHGDN